jgi:multisubunit Na+/H+ antiporter MnhG subunit
MRDAAVTALLVAGVALQLLACAGVLLRREALDRLHYASIGTPATLLVAAAVLVWDPISTLGGRAVLIAALTVFTAPVLTHATARALRR